MADFPALPLWTDAYIADTVHLTNEEHGVYLRLLMFAWRAPDCTLPDDDKRLALMVGVSPGKWEKIKPAVMAFWRLKGGKWHQKRLLAERDYVEKSRAQKSAAGKASAKAKALKNNDEVSTAVNQPLPTERQQPIPTPIKEKTEAKASSKKIGCRLPEDFKPDQEWSLAQGLSVDVLQREFDQFRDYWTAKSGKDATKLDWQATWRTWVRNTKARQGGINGRVKPKTQGEALRDMARERLSNGSGSQTGRLDFGDGARQTEGSVDDLRLALSANLGRKAG